MFEIKIKRKYIVSSVAFGSSNAGLGVPIPRAIEIDGINGNKYL